RSGQRALFARRPPAYEIAADEIDRTIIRSGRLLHIDGVDVSAALRAIEWAREADMTITMDGERIVPGVENVWPRVDLLVCNPRFLASATGTINPEAGLRVLASGGPPHVAVTLADKGALGLVDGRFVHTPGFSVSPVVDTNGAGDV